MWNEKIYSKGEMSSFKSVEKLHKVADEEEFAEMKQEHIEHLKNCIDRLQYEIKLINQLDYETYKANFKDIENEILK